MEQDWNNVRNHIAFRAEKSLGAIPWGKTEADVYIMTDCCKLNSVLRTKPKLLPSSPVKQCLWESCDSYYLNKSFAIRHILLKHLVWPAKCHKCRNMMETDIASHGCVQTCNYCNKDIVNSHYLTQHYYSAHNKFYCQLCEQVFHSLSEMKVHIMNENKMLVKSCMLCKFTSDEYDVKGNAMYKHMVQFHGSSQERMRYYNKKADSNADKEHVTADENAPEVVSKVIERTKPLRHETYQFDSFKCPHCGKLFSARSGLKIHGGIAHRKESIVFCPRCPETFSTVDECKAHYEDLHVKGIKKKKKEKSVENLPKRNVVPTNVPVETDHDETSNNADISNADDDSNLVFNDSEDDIQDNIIDVMDFSDDDNFEVEEENISEISIKKEDHPVADEAVDNGSSDVAKESSVERDEPLDAKSEESIEEMTAITIVEHPPSVKREPETVVEAEPPKKKKKPLPGLLKISSLPGSIPGTAPGLRVSPAKEVAAQVDSSSGDVRTILSQAKTLPRVLNLSSGKSVLISSNPPNAGNLRSGGVQLVAATQSRPLMTASLAATNHPVILTRNQVSKPGSTLGGLRLSPASLNQQQPPNSGCVSLATSPLQQAINSQSSYQVATSQATVHVLGGAPTSSAAVVQSSPVPMQEVAGQVPIHLTPGGKPVQVSLQVTNPDGQMVTRQIPVQLAPGQQSIRLIPCNPGGGSSQGVLRILSGQTAIKTPPVATSQIQLASSSSSSVGQALSSAGTSGQIKLVSRGSDTDSSGQIKLVARGSDKEKISLLSPTDLSNLQRPKLSAAGSSQSSSYKVSSTAGQQQTDQKTNFKLATSQGPVRVVKTISVNSGDSNPSKKIVILKSPESGQPEIINVTGNSSVLRVGESKRKSSSPEESIDSIVSRVISSSDQAVGGQPKVAVSSCQPAAASRVVLVGQKEDKKGLSSRASAIDDSEDDIKILSEAVNDEDEKEEEAAQQPDMLLATDKEEVYSDIMVEKVALNLPVVMTKRNNAKISQDNPCLEIFMKDGDVWGKCRACQQYQEFSLRANEGQIEKHFAKEHSISASVHRKKLYYEIRFVVKNSKYKRCFLCSYCGKEFTTKFNVRRHQMLYCPRKDEIDPSLLGLRPGQNAALAAKKVNDVSTVTSDANDKLDEIERQVLDPSALERQVLDPSALERQVLDPTALERQVLDTSAIEKELLEETSSVLIEEPETDPLA